MSGRYPEELELQKIEAWDAHDCDGLMAFVFSIWNWPEMATIEGGMWRLATGGWSGNEEIIAALKANTMFWLLCWQRSERGGLYWFKRWETRIVGSSSEVAPSVVGSTATGGGTTPTPVGPTQDG